jgi:hypothetical protein
MKCWNLYHLAIEGGDQQNPLQSENRILRHQIEGRVLLTDAERQTLAELGKKLGKQALEEVANIVSRLASQARR